ncbi:MAG: TetR/AcrR family transcriptional regulator [Clostridia bacterium]|nr:TetR/AcrR family transcriptional regulator [Clostridia bacterium]
MQYLKATVRNKIIFSAIAEFSQNGYSDASISNIAHNAGISLGNIYRYYANKSALFNTVVKPLYDDVGSYLKSAFLTDDLPLNEAVCGFIDRVLTNDVLFMIVNKSDAESVEKFNDLVGDAFTRKIKKELESHLASDNIIVHYGKMSRIISQSFLSVLYGILGDNHRKDRKREYAQEVTRFFFVNIEGRFQPKPEA